MNAAVEAARAGTHGRGFAVVASEVRSLSLVSAESAKQIKSLISNSVRRIECGSELVHAAGASMDGIVASIQHMATLIKRISAVSAEQSSGIGQINEAIAQIDRTTQDNALLVETAAAESAALQMQAETLAEAVAAFRLNEEPAVRASHDMKPNAPVMQFGSKRLAMGTPRASTVTLSEDESVQAYRECA